VFFITNSYHCLQQLPTRRTPGTPLKEPYEKTFL
jgi:hypothetical protein